MLGIVAGRRVSIATPLKSARRIMPLALKVKKKWVKRMVENGKTIEVRAFPPDDPKYIPAGATLAPGSEIYLLCEKEVWAKARLARVKRYESQVDFDADAAKHHAPTLII